MPPIKPEDAHPENKEIPEFVFEAFNELIEKNLKGKTAHIYQDDAVQLASEKSSYTRADIFNRGWMDVEPHYEAAGWKVHYDKPGYNESYPAYFEFTKPRS